MARDYQQFPDDDNGNVLWQMHEDGDDLTQAHEIEFSIVFQNQENAEACAIFLLREEQKITLFQDEDTNEWFITIYVYMEPDYEYIVDLEDWFTKIATQYQGEYDGWGCMAYVYDDDLDHDNQPI